MAPTAHTEHTPRLRALLRARLIGAVGAAMLAATGCGADPDRITPVCVPPDGGSCKSQDEMEAWLASFDDECSEVEGIHGGPRMENGNCCYDVGVYESDADECNVVEGRPFIAAGAAVTAALSAEARGWSARSDDEPELDLDDRERAALADAWSRSGLAEHASVASFARAALELMAVGAPAALVADAHRAALDEVHHAELCFGLAARYVGAPVGPSALPVGGALPLRTDLAELATATIHEGCVNETLAALLAREQLERCSDARVAAVLAAIAADETRHAELAWRTVAWAISVGGERVKKAARQAFVAALRGVPVGFAPPSDPSDARADKLAAHGRLDRGLTRELLERGLREVVAPCASRLMGSRAENRQQADA